MHCGFFILSYCWIVPEVLKRPPEKRRHQGWASVRKGHWGVSWRTRRGMPIGYWLNLLRNPGWHKECVKWHAEEIVRVRRSKLLAKIEKTRVKDYRWQCGCLQGFAQMCHQWQGRSSSETRGSRWVPCHHVPAGPGHRAVCCVKKANVLSLGCSLSTRSNPAHI